MKKIVSVLLSMFLILSLTATVFAETIGEGIATFDSDADAWNGVPYSFTPVSDCTVTVEISEAKPGYMVSVYDTDAGELVEQFANSVAETVTFNVTGGKNYEIIVTSCTYYGETLKFESAGTVTYKITSDDEGGVGGETSGESGGNEGGETDTAGSSENNPIIFGESTYIAEVPAGETIWYMYDNMFLPMFGTYAQNLNVVGTNEPEADEATYSVSYGVADAETGVPNVVEADPDGYVNINMEDRARQGKYIFAITNNSEYEDVCYITFTDVPVYVLTDINLEVGDNTVALDATAPTIIYNFSSGNVNIYDIDGNIVDTIVGAGAGTYLFTVKDTDGNIIEDALLSNWGTVGYPQDLTGDSKTNTFTWSTEEDSANLLLGVSGVTNEEFVINVARQGDYDDGKEQIVYTDYENEGVAGNFEMPAEELTSIDITKPQTVVLGSDGYYHFGAATGPIIYVDMTNEGANLVYCYYPADENGLPANNLRGQYTDENGVVCGYDFLGAMREYAEALTEDGFHPLTVDLAKYIQMYGSAQGWYMEGLSPFDAINNGEYIAESAWLVNAYYVEGFDVEPDDTTKAPEADDTTKAPEADDETKAPEADDTTKVPEADDATKAPESGTTSPVTDKVPTKAPQTGDSVLSAAVIAVIALAACATVLIIKKKKNCSVIKD